MQCAYERRLKVVFFPRRAPSQELEDVQGKLCLHDVKIQADSCDQRLSCEYTTCETHEDCWSVMLQPKLIKQLMFLCAAIRVKSMLAPVWKRSRLGMAPLRNDGSWPIVPSKLESGIIIPVRLFTLRCRWLEHST